MARLDLAGLSGASPDDMHLWADHARVAHKPLNQVLHTRARTQAHPSKVYLWIRGVLRNVAGATANSGNATMIAIVRCRTRGPLHRGLPHGAPQWTMWLTTLAASIATAVQGNQQLHQWGAVVRTMAALTDTMANTAAQTEAAGQRQQWQQWV